MLGNIFTVGQCAKLTGVSPNAVSKWFDSGRLRGYRIPGSQDRRVPKEYLVRFLKEHGMPLPAELSEPEDNAIAKAEGGGQKKTVEELHREHLSRVEKGVKEEWSAWTFAKAVGEILGTQPVSDQAACCVAK